MSARTLTSAVAVVVAASLAMGAWAAPAGGNYAGTAAPSLAYGVTDILKLSRAKVSDDTIIAYIKNSGDGFGLNAAQIAYLKQQGVSDAVIEAMLQQQIPGTASVMIPQPGTPAPLPVAATDPPTASASTPANATAGWPLVFNSGSTTYTIFEPQSDSWDGHNLIARSAAAIQSAGQSQPSYGVIAFSALTLLDKTTRTATLANIQVTRANFPSAPGQAQDNLALLRQEFPKLAPAMTLDRLQAGLNLPATASKAEPLNNAPPKIIVAMRPAELVSIDGPPAWRPVAGTDLERVINTRMLLLKDPAGHYYLHLFDGYLQANSLDGPWTVASTPPAGAATAEKEVTDSGQADLMLGEPDAATGKMPTLSASATPEVFVATTPSELICFNGQPEYASIPGTDLLYAENTSGNVFKSLSDQQNYILIAGRWYRAPALQGPWGFVPGNQLPRRFCQHPGHQPQGKREGQRAGDSPGGGSAGGQQHPAEHGGGPHGGDG